MTKLNKTEFMEKLGETKKWFNWEIDSFGHIRAYRKFKSKNVENCFCPLTAVQYAVDKTIVSDCDPSYVRAVRPTVKEYVIEAADYSKDCLSRTERDYRKKMMNVLGLKGE